MGAVVGWSIGVVVGWSMGVVVGWSMGVAVGSHPLLREGMGGGVAGGWADGRDVFDGRWAMNDVQGTVLGTEVSETSLTGWNNEAH